MLRERRRENALARSSVVKVDYLCFRVKSLARVSCASVVHAIEARFSRAPTRKRPGSFIAPDRRHYSVAESRKLMESGNEFQRCASILCNTLQNEADVLLAVSCTTDRGRWKT